MSGVNTFALSLQGYCILKACPCSKQIFLALKIENFQQKNFGIFLTFAQNIDCGYTLEPPL